jgi:hypothetical protein
VLFARFVPFFPSSPSLSVLFSFLPAHLSHSRPPQVLEETGFDLTPFFPPHQLHPSYSPSDDQQGGERDPYYVELVIREQKIRLYFIPGVAEGTVFETRTRKEISVRPLSGSLLLSSICRMLQGYRMVIGVQS